jgi:flagellum-specific peptidoglycan hydrolase FlgJ
LGPSVTHDDDAPGECFRAYLSPDESFKDHSNYLKTSQRYASLFKLDPTDYRGWAYGLKKAGYATNPQYPNILIKNIEQYNLQQYNEVATDEVKPVLTTIVDTTTKKPKSSN